MNTSVRIQLTCLVEIKAVAVVLFAIVVGQRRQPVADRSKPEQKEVPESTVDRSVPHDEPIRAAASALNTLLQDWNPLRACMAVVVADAPQLELVFVEVHDESWMVRKFVLLSPQRFPLIRIHMGYLVGVKAVAAVLSATVVGQVDKPEVERNKPEQEEVPERSVPHDEPIRAAVDTVLQNWNPLRACMAVVVADAPQLELVLVEVHDESWMVRKSVVLSPQRFPLIRIYMAYLVGIKAVAAAVLFSTEVGQVYKS